MTRYYFDLIEDGDHCCDDEGLDYSDMGSARAHAIDAIRCILSSRVRAGKFSLEGVVEIRNDLGVLEAVPFSEAVSLA